MPKLTTKENTSVETVTREGGAVTAFKRPDYGSALNTRAFNAQAFGAVRWHTAYPGNARAITSGGFVIPLKQNIPEALLFNIGQKATMKPRDNGDGRSSNYDAYVAPEIEIIILGFSRDYNIVNEIDFLKSHGITGKGKLVPIPAGKWVSDTYQAKGDGGKTRAKGICSSILSMYFVFADDKTNLVYQMNFDRTFTKFGKALRKAFNQILVTSSKLVGLPGGSYIADYSVKVKLGGGESEKVGSVETSEVIPAVLFTTPPLDDESFNDIAVDAVRFEQLKPIAAQLVEWLNGPDSWDVCNKQFTPEFTKITGWQMVDKGQKDWSLEKTGSASNTPDTAIDGRLDMTPAAFLKKYTVDDLLDLFASKGIKPEKANGIALQLGKEDIGEVDDAAIHLIIEAALVA